jgi:hypothetical protein
MDGTGRSNAVALDDILAPLLTTLDSRHGSAHATRLDAGSDVTRPEEGPMYTRITTGRFETARAQEVQDLVAQAVANAARDLPGFKSYNGGLDRQAGRLAAVTTWETEAQARGFRDKLPKDVMQLIQDAGVQLDESQIYETVISV